MSTGPVAVVVVSHDGENCAVLRRIFRQNGWRVLERHAVASFRDALKPRWSGVVLTESRLPDGTWEDILRYTEERCPHARVVVMSRLADDELWAEVLNRGGFDLLAEPVDENEVVRVGQSAWRQLRTAIPQAVA